MIVLLKVFLWQGKHWTQRELAESLGMNLAEVNHSLKRLEALRLYNPIRKHILKQTALEFILYGLRLAFPAELGPVKLGFPTAHAALSNEILFNDNDLYVWPDSKGPKRGQSIKPLHKAAPVASANDPKLYRLLSLIDVLRVGQAREKNFAKQQLSEMFATA
ncbi:MAG: hypothetical protein U0136_16270 [Bdellovibrionota bacterium]